MTPQDAGRIVTYLTAKFHRDALEAEAAIIFAKDVSLLQDYDVGIVAADELARSQDRFPTIREFRDAYHGVARRRGAERSQTHGIEPAKASAPGPTPEWVFVWSWARNRREPPDERNLPQMVDHETGLPFGRDEYMTPAEYEQLAEEWRQAGSPKSLRVSDRLLRQD